MEKIAHDSQGDRRNANLPLQMLGCGFVRRRATGVAVRLGSALDEQRQVQGKTRHIREEWSNDGK